MLIIARSIAKADIHGMMLVDSVHGGQIHPIRIYRVSRHPIFGFHDVPQREVISSVQLETEPALLLLVLSVCDAKRGTRQ